MIGKGRATLITAVIITALVGGCHRAGATSGIKSEASFSSAPPPRDPLEPMVLIGATGALESGRLGLGSVLGDGTLVVTAYHLVFQASETGRHTTNLLPMVISPYLGEVCYGRLLAADRKLDLALLQVPWLGHPSFQLLEDQCIHQLDHVAVCSPGMEHSGPEPSSTASTHIDPTQMRTERLPVESVLCRQGIPAEIRLTGFGRLGPGWSGAPMLAEPGHRWAGCFARIYEATRKIDVSLLPDRNSVNPRMQEAAFGAACGWVRKLLADTGNLERLRPRGTGHPRPADANQATEHFLRAMRLSRLSPSRREERAQELDEFLRLRPASTYVMAVKAGQLATSGEQTRAEELYRQAIQQDPANTCVITALGEFLERGNRAREAQEQYERARQLEPRNSYVADGVARIICVNEPEDIALEKINALIAEFPDDRYLLAAKAQVYARQKKTEDVITMLKDVVRFAPEELYYRGVLANELQRMGKLEEAEVQLRDIIAFKPDDPQAYLRLARFLAKCRPEAREKAVETAKQALALASQQGSDAAAIQNLLRELESR